MKLETLKTREFLQQIFEKNRVSGQKTDQARNYFGGGGSARGKRDKEGERQGENWRKKDGGGEGERRSVR